MAKRKTRRRMARGYYRMTPKRATALKKAQLISAKKRSLNKKKVVAGVAAAAVIGGVVARHKLSGSEFSMTLSKMNKSNLRRNQSTRPDVNLRTHTEIERFGSRFAGSPSPSAKDVTNRVIIGHAGVRNLFGVGFSYRHRPLTKNNIAVVRGTKTKPIHVPVGKPPRKVDRDSIPLYTPQGYKVDRIAVTDLSLVPWNAKFKESKGGSPRFPHMGAKASKKQNKKMREEGLIK